MPGPGTWSAGDILTADDLNAIGLWTSYTPVLEQSGTRSATVDYAEYVVINKMCIANVKLTCTTSGSSGSRVNVSLPLTAATTAEKTVVGSGYFFIDGNDVQLVSAAIDTTTKLSFFNEASTGNPWGQSPSTGLLNGNVISFNVMYEVA